MLIAQTYLEEGRLEEMEAVARQYLARHPGNAHLLNFLGYAFADKNMRLEEAEQLIRRALEAAPDNGSIVDSLGWVLYRKGRVEEAIAELERAARLSPDSPDHRPSGRRVPGRQAARKSPRAVAAGAGIGPV
ncbi:tetratricopeptide repeat protein [bacterium]|nr:tetratricopeptide repeat protein [bacterium]